MTRRDKVLAVLFALAVGAMAWLLAWLVGGVRAAPVEDMPQARATAFRFPPDTGSYLVLPRGVVDGDTVKLYLLVDLGNCRLARIDAPELPTGEGKAAAKHLAELLPQGQGPCTAVFRGREKWGRPLVEILDTRGRNLSSEMLQAGHARPWDGRGMRP